MGHSPQIARKGRRAGIFTAPWLIALTVLTWTAPTASAQDASLEQRIFAAFDKEQYQQALDLIETYLKDHPNDTGMLYNGACALCQLTRPDDAAGMLHRALKAGFRDFDHMRRDPDLALLRDHPVYRRIMQEAEKAASVRSGDALEQWQGKYGRENYRVEHDNDRRLVYAVALDETSFKDMRAMLERQADQAVAALFKEMPASTVLIAVPTPEDGRDFFNGRRDIGGIYENGPRRLVARDIGGSLRHEFIHLLHYGHMERLRQKHPLWMQEGLASLYESYEWTNDGTIRFLPNQRQAINKRRVRGGSAMRWDALMNLESQPFMEKAANLYPQVRSIFEFLAVNGKLESWYAAYTAGYEKDPTGGTAFEAVFALPLPDVERQWKKWVLQQPDVDIRIDMDDAALGIRSRENGANDGVLVTDILPGSGAGRAGMKKSDVIVAMDEQPVRSMQELIRLVGQREIGDVVNIRLRRGLDYLTFSVRLGAMRGGF